MSAVHPVQVQASPEERAAVGLLGSAVGMAVVLGLMLLGGYHLVLRHLRHTPEADEAAQLLHSSMQLRRLLGEPVEFRLEAGELRPDGTGASFSYNAEGPYGDAAVELELVRHATGWQLASGTVETDDGVMPLYAP
jgi:hypothetical protein